MARYLGYAALVPLAIPAVPGPSSIGQGSYRTSSAPPSAVQVADAGRIDGPASSLTCI